MEGPTGWGISPLSLLESFAWNFPPARSYCDTLVSGGGGANFPTPELLV